MAMNATKHQWLSYSEIGSFVNGHLFTVKGGNGTYTATIEYSIRNLSTGVDRAFSYNPDRYTVGIYWIQPLSDSILVSVGCNGAGYYKSGHLIKISIPDGTPSIVYYDYYNFGPYAKSLGITDSALLFTDGSNVLSYANLDSLTTRVLASARTVGVYAIHENLLYFPNGGKLYRYNQSTDTEVELDDIPYSWASSGVIINGWIWAKTTSNNLLGFDISTGEIRITNLSPPGYPTLNNYLITDGNLIYSIGPYNSENYITVVDPFTGQWKQIIVTKPDGVGKFSKGIFYHNNKLWSPAISPVSWS